MSDKSEGTYPDCPTILRTVEVGGRTKDELLREFQTHAISMNAYGTTLFDDPGWEPSGSAYNLPTVEVTVRQLGFPAGSITAEIYARAERLGLSLCPIETGPFLRLQYLDQPAGYWITIASLKLSDDPDFPNGFYLRRLDDGLWLRGYTAAPEHVWDAEDHFVFCRDER